MEISHKTKKMTDTIGIPFVNVWDSTSRAFKQGKSKWNELIDTAGMIAGVENPRMATREDCMRGWREFSKKLTGKEINAGASVLDPFACELILKLFLPKKAKAIYNPFGGGVQMGFIAGFYELNYLATEIRKNQCDANNAICAAMQMNGVKWECSDSSTYIPAEKYDLIFTCPPYYKVEHYVDYDGNPPKGELNDLPDYDNFRRCLFDGYKKAIESLNGNCFFVIMVGDSRNKQGSYYCTESETELFLRDCGLHIYNRIVYLEHWITRAVMGANTLKSRKIPKVEQKIICAYKGNINNIPNKFSQINFTE